MMSFAHIADTHLGHRQYGLKQREEDMAASLRAAIVEMVDRRSADAIVLAGDLFHSRDLRPKILHQAERILERVPGDIPVVVSRGNHDENLTPRDLTWLNYLHERELIILLQADLEADTEVAHFEPYDPADPGVHAGFYDLESEGLSGPIRFFGLQWRGARTDQALQQVAAGVEGVNKEYGAPAFTVLLAHFGIEDEVPTLGATITHHELDDLQQHIDYLALGHIHKRYDAHGWVFNPGSPEMHSTREGHPEWEHGYYTVTLSPTTSEEGDSPRRIDVAHHQTKRRPYYRITFEVTEHQSPGQLVGAFRSHIDDEADAVRAHCQQPPFMTDGALRAPLIDLRFTGTLQFARREFPTEELSTYARKTLDAIHVRENDGGMRTATVQRLLKDLDEEDLFIGGRLNTEALERQVFEIIASDSRFGAHREAVAALLSDAHRMAQGNEAIEDIRDVVASTRRDLFPEMTADVSVDVPDDPLLDTDKSGRTT